MSPPAPDRSGHLNFVIDAELCVSCLACVRVCPTDAIAVAADEPLLLQVVDEACIRCGQCLPACPHSAVKVNGEIGRALAIAAQGDGVLILSPESVAHFYPATPEQLINACYEAGFRAVTRGVIGDELVAAEYLKLWEEEPWGTLIRSTDPVVVETVRVQFPELLPYLAPVTMPAVPQDPRARRAAGGGAGGGGGPAGPGLRGHPEHRGGARPSAERAHRRVVLAPGAAGQHRAPAEPAADRGRGSGGERGGHVRVQAAAAGARSGGGGRHPRADRPGPQRAALGLRGLRLRDLPAVRRGGRAGEGVDAPVHPVPGAPGGRSAAGGGGRHDDRPVDLPGPA